jgi:abhydrolase domain-containing protein 12
MATKLELMRRALSRCENLQLLLVHAEDDGTMPWDQTEELFKTTLRAATEAVGPNVKVVDLGEAGKQEVWRQGARSISKLIAKHGGKWPPQDTVDECEMGIL